MFIDTLLVIVYVTNIYITCNVYICEINKDHQIYNMFHILFRIYIDNHLSFFFLDVFGWPQPSCFFPSWLTRYTWRDLSADGYYVSNTVGSEINGMHDMTIARIHAAFRCIKVTTDESEPKSFIVNSFTSDEW